MRWVIKCIFVCSALFCKKIDLALDIFSLFPPSGVWHDDDQVDHITGPGWNSHFGYKRNSRQMWDCFQETLDISAMFASVWVVRECVFASQARRWPGHLRLLRKPLTDWRRWRPLVSAVYGRWLVSSCFSSILGTYIVDVINERFVYKQIEQSGTGGVQPPWRAVAVPCGVRINDWVFIVQA